MTKRIWVAWLFNGDQVVTRFAGDKPVEDDQGFVACECPVQILEGPPERDSLGQTKVPIMTRPLSSSIDTSELVHLRLTGYAVCNNPNLIKLWEQIHLNTSTPHVTKPGGLVTPR